MMAGFSARQYHTLGVENKMGNGRFCNIFSNSRMYCRFFFMLQIIHIHIHLLFYDDCLCSGRSRRRKTGKKTTSETLIQQKIILQYTKMFLSTFRIPTLAKQ